MIKKMVVVIVLMALVLGVAPQRGLAQSADIDPQGKYVRFEYVRRKSLYGLEWTDEKGILHVRHRTDIGLIEGSLNGYAVVIFNCDVNTKTGNGTEYGTVTIYETVSDKAPKKCCWNAYRIEQSQR